MSMEEMLKSETRRPRAERRPKSEIRKEIAAKERKERKEMLFLLSLRSLRFFAANWQFFGFRNSVFFRASVLGFRTF
jgi:hypothetical protein